MNARFTNLSELSNRYTVFIRKMTILNWVITKIFQQSDDVRGYS